MRVVTAQEYLPLRLELLEREKELTRAHDALARERQALPMVEVTTAYTFTDVDECGKEVQRTLKGLFAGRKQLVIYHFMFEPDADAGCASCTLHGEALSSQIPHLNARGVTLVCVSRAPIAKIRAYRDRLGFQFPWVSANGSTFNQDFQVTQLPEDPDRQYNFVSKDEHLKHGRQHFTHGEQPGVSCFIIGDKEKDIGEDGVVYHTYSAYARATDGLTPALQYLDLTKLGRRESMVQKVGGTGFRRHDEYSADELKGIWT